MNVDRVKSATVARQVAEAEYVYLMFLRDLLKEMDLDDGLERLIVNRIGPQAELSSQSSALSRDLQQELDMFGIEGFQKNYCAPIRDKFGK